MPQAWLFGKIPDAPNTKADARHGERGYLLVLSGVMILVLVGLLSSYSFVVKRDASYKANFAAGQRFADIAAAAHYYAQSQAYDPPGAPINNCNLLPAMNLPGGAALPALPNTTLTIEICGAPLAPVHNDTPPTPVVPANVKAASAYAVLRIRSNGTRAPSDTIAFLAGAASHGMDRVGLFGTNAGGECNDDPTGAVMRWGPDRSACLTNALLNIIGTNVATLLPGDIVVPVWETALAQNEQEVIYRYKQPERPDMNTMGTDLLFEDSTAPPGPVVCADVNTNCLQGVSTLSTNQLVVAAGGTPANSATTMEDVTVRLGSQTRLLQQAIINDNVNIYDQTAAPGDAMTVTGAVNLSADATPNAVSVSGTLSRNAPGTLDVTATNPIQTNVIGARVGGSMIPTTINLSGVNPKAVFDPVIPNQITVGDLNMTSTDPTKGLNILGTVSNPFGVTPTRLTYGVSNQINLYAANLNYNAASIATDDPMWDVGSIEQTGNSLTQYFKMGDLDYLRIDQDCIGRACPNAVNQAPGGGF